MRQIVFTLLIFFNTSVFAQQDSIPIVNKVDSLHDPFENLVYDKVLAYNFNYDSASRQKRHDYIYFGENLEKFNFYHISKFSLKTLDSNTTKELIKIISDTSTYGKQYADCFEPRLGFTFFSKNKPVYTVLICFGCGFLESSSPIPASYQNYYDIESYEWDYEKQEAIKNKPIYVRRYLKGFSNAGEERLMDLCRKLNMQYCKD